MSIYDESTTTYLVFDERTGMYTGLADNPNKGPEARLISVHKLSQCEQRNCAIHDNPSLHPLTMEPLVWDEVYVAVKRQCVHGVIHPDVDDLGYRKTVGQYYLYLEHDCDGCCGLEQPE